MFTSGLFSERGAQWRQLVCTEGKGARTENALDASSAASWMGRAWPAGGMSVWEGGMSVGWDDDKGGDGHGTHGLVRSAGVGVLVLGRDGDRLPELYDMISAELDWIEGEQKAEADLCLALDVPVRERGRVEGDLAEGLCLGEGGEGAGHGREGDDARRRRLGCVLARHPRR